VERAVREIWLSGLLAVGGSGIAVLAARLPELFSAHHATSGAAVLCRLLVGIVDGIAAVVGGIGGALAALAALAVLAVRGPRAAGRGVACDACRRG
jgi:hypothetical protein